MSCFKNSRFAKELAYRTMVNYYNLRDFPPDATKPGSPERQCVLEKMRGCGFVISQHNEVTLALNSMIGLLILPQQEYYSESLSSSNFDKLPKLEHCICAAGYINTYNEERKPANVLRHMRNSIAHNRVMIIPESADNKDITHILFRDVRYLDDTPIKPFRDNADLSRQINKKRTEGVTVYEFNLPIPVEELEGVLMEIAEYLIGLAG